MYWLILFLMYSNRAEYIMFGLTTLNFALLWKVFLSMLSPLVIRVSKPTARDWKRAMRYTRIKTRLPKD